MLEGNEFIPEPIASGVDCIPSLNRRLLFGAILQHGSDPIRRKREFRSQFRPRLVGMTTTPTASTTRTLHPDDCPSQPRPAPPRPALRHSSPTLIGLLLGTDDLVHSIAAHRQLSGAEYVRQWAREQQRSPQMELFCESDVSALRRAS